MSRYIDVSENVIEMYRGIVENYFPTLLNCHVKILFDTKKRTSEGNIVLASIKKSNDLIKYFTEDEVDEGYDFVLFLDKNCWDNIEDIDRERIIRHELCHVLVDIDSLKTPYKLIGHEISDFYSEIERNVDDPRWRERVGSLTYEIYEQIRDDK